MDEVEVLKKLGLREYLLVPLKRRGTEYVEIHVKNLTVYIKQDDEGVSVEIQGEDEEEECLASCWATYAEGEADAEDEDDG